MSGAVLPGAGLESLGWRSRVTTTAFDPAADIWLTANALSYLSKRDSGRSGRNALI